MAKFKPRFRVRGKKNPEGSRSISGYSPLVLSHRMNSTNVRRIVAELPNDVLWDRLDAKDKEFVLYFKTEQDLTWFNMKYSHTGQENVTIIT